MISIEGMAIIMEQVSIDMFLSEVWSDNDQIFHKKIIVNIFGNSTVQKVTYIVCQ